MLSKRQESGKKISNVQLGYLAQCLFQETGDGKNKANKKQGETEFLTDLKQTHQVYAQSVYRNNLAGNSIPYSNEYVKENLEKNLSEDKGSGDELWAAALGVGGVDSVQKVRYNEGTTIRTEDRSNGSENAQVLGGREGIRQVDRGGDGLWEQSENSRKISEWLEIDRGDRRVLQTIRAGSSGWHEDIREDQRDVLRFGTGVLRNLSGKEIKDTDSAGRSLSEELMSRLAGTVFKGEDGTILSLYHWTDAEFDSFSMGDIGFHFGTADASHKRHEDKKRRRTVRKSIYKEVYLNIKNPAFIPYDPVRWCPLTACHKLVQYGYIEDWEHEEIEKLPSYLDGVYDSQAAIALRELLSTKGIDGILYTNICEGGLSAIAFAPSQIVTVAENGMDKQDC